MIANLPGGIMEWSAGGLSVGLGLYAARMLGSSVKWLVVYFTGRIDQKEQMVDAEMVSLITELKQQNTDLAGRFATHIQTSDEREQRRLAREAALEERIHNLEDELRQCERKHADSEAKVARLEAMMQGMGDARDKAQLIIAADKKEARA